MVWSGSDSSLQMRAQRGCRKPRALNQRFEFGATATNAARFKTHRRLRVHAKCKRIHWSHHRTGCKLRGNFAFISNLLPDANEQTEHTSPTPAKSEGRIT